MAALTAAYGLRRLKRALRQGKHLLSPTQPQLLPSGAIVKRQVDVTPSIEFTYDSREYTAFLTDYNGAHYEEGKFDYYI